MQPWSPCLAQCCRCKGLPQEGTSVCFSVRCDLTFLFVCSAVQLVHPCTCVCQRAISDTFLPSSLPYSFEIGSLTEPGVCWFSAKLATHWSIFLSSPPPPLYPQHWGDRQAHRHARLFMWVLSIQTQLPILVNQGSLPTEPSLQLLLVFA